jgi:hypothetical protein
MRINIHMVIVRHYKFSVQYHTGRAKPCETFRFRGYLVIFVFGSHVAIARFQRPYEAR